MVNTHPIGKPVPRKEGRKKVTGQALYVDDLSFPDMLHGATVRSPVARGKITNISFDGDIPWDELAFRSTHEALRDYFEGLLHPVKA